MYVDEYYGVSLISRESVDFKNVVNEYYSKLDFEITQNDTEFDQKRKRNLKVESDLMSQRPVVKNIVVYYVTLGLDQTTYMLATEKM